eukprot:gene10262-biopygen7748
MNFAPINFIPAHGIRVPGAPARETGHAWGENYMYDARVIRARAVGIARSIILRFDPFLSSRKRRVLRCAWRRLPRRRFRDALGASGAGVSALREVGTQSPGGTGHWRGRGAGMARAWHGPEVIFALGWRGRGAGAWRGHVLSPQGLVPIGSDFPELRSLWFFLGIWNFRESREYKNATARSCTKHLLVSA